VLLLSRPFKREFDTAGVLAVWLLIAHYVDLFWMIETYFSTDFPLVHWLTICDPPFAMGGLGCGFSSAIFDSKR